VIVRAEFALFAAATALSVVALVSASRRGDQAWRMPTAFLVGLAAAATPLLLYQFVDPTFAAGRALWEWTAAGGPTIQASYRLDGIGAIGIAATCGYAAAGLLASARSAASPRSLPALVLAIGFVSIAVVVTNDLVAAVVALAVLAALTAFATLLVAPPPSAMRLAAYLTAGLQGFVVGALLVARQGGASLAIADLAPTAISPGAVLATTAGAALFAGLYPFVPWRYERAQARAAEREPLRGLLAMPAGVAASLILVRFLGATSIDLSELSLPEIGPIPRSVLAAVVLIGFFVRARIRRRPSRRLVIVTALSLLILGAYPMLHWSYVVLAAALLTVLYAAAVSLALPEQWEVTRHDVTLAMLWVALACGTPVALASGLILLAAAAFGSLLESIWMPPHRAYIATVVTGTWMVVGVLGVAIGAGAAADPPTAIAAIAIAGGGLILILLQAGRRLAHGEAPLDLEVAAAIAALIASTLLGLLLEVPVADALRQMGRPLGPLEALFAIAALVVATVLVIAAGALRPFVPDLETVAARLQRFVWAADPVPAGVSAFRVLERAVTLSSAGFGLFEERAGVWLATILIVALLIWSTR
jgi:hypothetical protein